MFLNKTFALFLIVLCSLFFPSKVVCDHRECPCYANSQSLCKEGEVGGVFEK